MKVQNKPTAEEAVLDRHLEAIMQASGSALRHCDFCGTVPAMRAALKEAIRDSAAQSLPPVADAGDAFERINNTARTRADAGRMMIEWAQVQQSGALAALAAKDAEIAECDELREKMAGILSRVAVALLGPEPPLTRWDWSNLPEIAAGAALMATTGSDALAARDAEIAKMKPYADWFRREESRADGLDRELDDAKDKLATVTAERDTLAAQIAKQKPVIEAAEEWWSERSPEDWAEGNLMKALATMNGDWEGCEGCDHECGESCMPATVDEIHASVDAAIAQLEKACEGSEVMSADTLARDFAAVPTPPTSRAKFKRGDRVYKTKGTSEWWGVVVGEYSTEGTPYGVAVESGEHEGSVQIYPESVLELADERPAPPIPGRWLKTV